MDTSRIVIGSPSHEVGNLRRSAHAAIPQQILQPFENQL